MTGCLTCVVAVLLVILWDSLLRFIGADETLRTLLDFFLFMGVLLAASIWQLEKQDKQKERVKEIEKKLLGDEPHLAWATVELIGGNHPLLGSSQRAVRLLVSESHLIITDLSTGAGTRIPLVQIKAQVATQSAVSAMGILLFGLLALGAKDTLLVLDFDDPASKEHYHSVFRGINNPEVIADAINKQRYSLLIKNAEPQRSKTGE